MKVVVRTNLPQPAEAASRLLLAAVKIFERVRLPEFAGVNYFADIVLAVALVYLVNPELTAALTPRHPELVALARLSTIVVWFVLFIWCNWYTVTRSSRWRNF